MCSEHILTHIDQTCIQYKKVILKKLLNNNKLTIFQK